MNLAEKSACTGCGACANICNFQAIEMVEDKRGFKYPQINNKCKKCGQCQNICPIQNSVCNKAFRNSGYAVVHKNEELHKISSSGGVFYELAREIIKSGGAVYGGAWDGKCGVKHISVTDEVCIEKLLKSKYIQSDVGFSYRSVKEDLISGKKVLYSGTPCQVDGLKSFLGKEYENLICIDVVCHGVPNKRVFSEFIEILENKEHGEIHSYCFREKTKEIGCYATSYIVNQKKIVKQWTQLSYGYLFMKSYILRDSCYSCKYAQKNRIGDITLGDFWGVNKVDKSFDINSGVSAVIINSTKGEALFSKINCSFRFIEVPYDSIYENNDQLTRPATKPIDRDSLWEQYVNQGYIVFEKYYKRKTLLVRWKAKLKMLMINAKNKYMRGNVIK